MIDFDDFDWEDGVIIGSFSDYMVDQEKEDEKARKKLEREMFGPDEPEKPDEEDEY